MRYVKVLILALFFFLCLVFLFQNQNVLSQKLTLELNLLAIPKMTSIELPFYFIILVSFLAGCVMALLLLLWDRMRLSAHILQQTWRISNLEIWASWPTPTRTTVPACSPASRPSI